MKSVDDCREPTTARDAIEAFGEGRGEMTDDDAKMVASLRHAAQLVYDYMSRSVSSDIEAAAAEFERLAAENARLTAEVERLSLRWSSERPKVAGLYIVRVEPAPGLWHSQWFEEWSEDDVTGRLWFAGHEHAGPIVVREPARGEERGE